MLPEAHAFIATSLDGCIADRHGGIGWLTGLPVPEGEDHGYAGFMAGMDALVMGRRTYETVLGFEAWPYDKPVVVLSGSLGPNDLRADLAGRARILPDGPAEILARLGAEGARRVYVDGGRVISAFLRAGLLTRLVLTRVPVILGGGAPLFVDTGPARMSLVESRVWPHGFVQTTYAAAP